MFVLTETFYEWIPQGEEHPREIIAVSENLDTLKSYLPCFKNESWYLKNKVHTLKIECREETYSIYSIEYAPSV